jgi:hypothetical protein
VAEIHTFFKQKYDKIALIGELNSMGVDPKKDYYKIMEEVILE